MNVSLTPDRATHWNVDSDEHAASPASLEEPALLPPDEAAGDGVTEMALLLARSFREDRRRATQASDAAQHAAMREAEAQLAAMKERADAIRSAGWIEGLAQAAAGGFQVGGVGASLKASNEAAERWMSLGSGTGKGVEGLGKLAASGYNGDATEHQARADAHGTRAEAQRSIAEKSDDAARDAWQMERKIYDFLENVTQTREKTSGAASSKG